MHVYTKLRHRNFVDFQYVSNVLVRVNDLDLVLNMAMARAKVINHPMEKLHSSAHIVALRRWSCCGCMVTYYNWTHLAVLLFLICYCDHALGPLLLRKHSDN